MEYLLQSKHANDQKTILTLVALLPGTATSHDHVLHMFFWPLLTGIHLRNGQDFMISFNQSDF